MRQIYVLTIFLILACDAYGDLETLGGDDVDIKAFDHETLFISLGSYCAPASLARTCGLRHAAFPFDWNISMDGEKVIEMIRDGFSSFLNKEFLVPFGWATLLNTYYHLEFVHDGNWDGNNYDVYLPILQSKYERRINRFQQLKNHRGKIYFMRSAFVHSLVDKNRYYNLQENIEISDDCAVRLFEALKDVFPGVDLSLMVFNNHEPRYMQLEKKLSDSILIFRVNPFYDESDIEASYVNLFEQLLKNEPLESGYVF